MTNSQISDIDFSKLIQQANLVLSDDQKQSIQSQLGEALSAVDVLSELDTSSIQVTTSASGLTNVMREDLVTPSFTQAEALSNAAMAHNGFFVVPAIFEATDN